MCLEPLDEASTQREQRSPRPLLVQLALWSDNLPLRECRDRLRQTGIRISGDFRRRQTATVKELRQQGKHVYYRHYDPLEEDRSTVHRYDSAWKRDRW